MAPIPLLKILIYPIKHPRVHLRRTRQAHAKRKVMQPGDADRFAVQVLVDRGDGGEDGDELEDGSEGREDWFGGEEDGGR